MRWPRRRRAEEGRLSCHEVSRLVQRYLDDETDRATAAAVAAHLEDCRRCGMEADAYRDIKALCVAVGGPCRRLPSAGSASSETGSPRAIRRRPEGPPPPAVPTPAPRPRRSWPPCSTWACWWPCAGTGTWSSSSPAGAPAHPDLRRFRPPVPCTERRFDATRGPGSIGAGS